MCDNTINKDEKLKYNDKAFERELEINKVIYVPGMFPSSSNNQSSNIDIETKLLKAESTYKQKNIMKLDTDQDNKNKDYRNFSMVSEKSRESINHGNYVRNGFKGSGRGFGDVNIDAELRYGANSREEKKTARSQDLKDYKFHDMFPNFHDEKHVVLPFARGGIDTRNLDKYRNKN
jgi:hypothetical protein